MSKKTYKVTGGVPYRGIKPGEEFDASLSDDQERRAVERGSIKIVNKTTGKGSKADA